MTDAAPDDRSGRGIRALEAYRFASAYARSASRTNSRTGPRAAVVRAEALVGDVHLAESDDVRP